MSQDRSNILERCVIRRFQALLYNLRRRTLLHVLPHGAALAVRVEGARHPLPLFLRKLDALGGRRFWSWGLVFRRLINRIAAGAGVRIAVCAIRALVISLR